MDTPRILYIVDCQTKKRRMEKKIELKVDPLLYTHSNIRNRLTFWIYKCRAPNDMSKKFINKIFLSTTYPFQISKCSCLLRIFLNSLPDNNFMVVFILENSIVSSSAKSLVGLWGTLKAKLTLSTNNNFNNAFIFPLWNSVLMDPIIYIRQTKSYVGVEDSRAHMGILWIHIQKAYSAPTTRCYILLFIR